MSLDKKGFAEIIENAINESKCIGAYNKNFAKSLNYSDEEFNGIEYKYNRYMEKLTLSKVKRLYSILSTPAYSRINSMSDREVEDYRKDKLSEIAGSINRLMLAIEVSRNESEKREVKDKVEALVTEQTSLKEMTCEMLKRYVIDKLELKLNGDDTAFDGKGETYVLQNIVKDKESLSEFIRMVNEYRNAEREIKGIRAEQIIIYNDLLNGNIKGDISIDELFSEESLNSLQTTIAAKLKEINDAETGLKIHFGSKTKKSYYKLKSSDYKTNKDGKTLPYDKGVIETFEEIIPSRTVELAMLQNDEWLRLNKKVFKTAEVNSTLALLSIEIDETKELIDSYIKDWYKNAYYNNSLFGPVSSRASGRFEYSLGAKDCLDKFIKFGVWPEEKDIASLKLCLKLNRMEAEKSIIYAEQIKEKLKRLFNQSLNNKKKSLEELDERIVAKYGNWKNEVILSIVNEIK